VNDHVVIYNLTDRAERRRLMEYVATLDGLYEVTIKKRRRTRSLEANSYYFAAIVTPFREYLRREWGDPSLTTEQAHEALKRAVLGTTVLTAKDGRELELLPPTHTMDTAEFSTYIDNCAAFIDSFAGITPLPRDLFYEGGG
jgi:hypothetical protein